MEPQTTDPETTEQGRLDAQFMDLALALAERGRGRVSPNPLVGCVIVQGGNVVGEGWHARAGEPHAELVALRKAEQAAAGSTCYVTLEPCDHQGRTPPCTEALLAAGVARVVVATTDPNPLVDGKGVRRLREAGVAVDVGVRQQEAEAQNEVFRTNHLQGRPFVLYKTAMSLDGKIAVRTGRSRWITGPSARARVHHWRDEYDAVAVGMNTLLLDDPALTTRIPGGRTPTKVVFDSLARTPVTARLFAPSADGMPARVIVVVTDDAPAARMQALAAAGAEIVSLPAKNGRPPVPAALAALLALGITSIMLEGGGSIAWEFFSANAVDRVAWFVAPKLLGGSAAGPLGGLGVASIADAYTLTDVLVETIGPDLLISGKVATPAAQASTGAGDETGA